MPFDEEKFYIMLQKIDCSEAKIKNICSYVLNNAANYKIIINIWHHIFTSEKRIDTKLALFYLMHEIMNQTHSLLNNKFIVNFGPFLNETINDLILYFNDDYEMINQFIKIIKIWEVKLFFTNKFIDKLLEPLLKIKEKIYNEDNKIYVEDNKKYNQFMNLIADDINKSGILINLEDKNINNIYNTIDYKKINDYLMDSKIKSPEEYREREKFISFNLKKIIGLKNIIISQISKREDYIMKMSELLQNDKDVFFQNLQNKYNNI